MGNIYWLASYPKSGNTWMRILLTNYLRDASDPADINYLDGGPIASARQAFEDHVGIEASDLTQAEIDRYRPYVYEQMSQKASEPLYLKVHDAFTANQYGCPIISKAATAGVIYMIRNPLDVVVSFAHHNSCTVAEMAHDMGQPDFALVEMRGALGDQFRQVLLSWSGHASSWVDEPGLRILVVRYEDLHTDPLGTFARVVEFCNLEKDPVRLEKAVQFSRFEELRRQEEAHGFSERPPNANNFFRKGQIGSWSEELPPELVQMMVNDHAAVMQRFGYLDKNGKLVY